MPPSLPSSRARTLAPYGKATVRLWAPAVFRSERSQDEADPGGLRAVAPPRALEAPRRPLPHRQPVRRAAEPDDLELGHAGLPRAQAAGGLGRDDRARPTGSSPTAAVSRWRSSPARTSTVVRKFVKPAAARPRGAHARRLCVPGRAERGADPRGRGRLSGLRAAPNRLELGSHSLFVGEVIDAGFARGGEDVAVLRMEDTRMNYGG